MIDIQNLSFNYGKKTILKNISLELEAGKIYGLLGENGVGKTTLLKLISGLQKPSSGKCSVNGEIPFKRKPGFLSNIYYLPEELEFVQVGLTPTQFAKLNGDFYPNFNNKRFEEILSKFSVNPNQKLNKMSQGQTKKAAIAFAIATGVDLLLLDEPSNGLDIPSKTLLRGIIAEYCLDTTCTIISTHQVRDLENLIDPIIILDNQEVLLNASLEKISEKLYFSMESVPADNALYTEQTLGGYLCVTENKGFGESRINIEALFNATMDNKDRMKQLFK